MCQSTRINICKPCLKLIMNSIFFCLPNQHSDIGTNQAADPLPVEFSSRGRHLCSFWNPYDSPQWNMIKILVHTTPMIIWSGTHQLQTQTILWTEPCMNLFCGCRMSGQGGTKPSRTKNVIEANLQWIGAELLFWLQQKFINEIK